MSNEERAGAPVTTDTRARQGITPHVTRYVLVYGLLFVVVAFVIVYLVLGHRIHL